MQVGKESLLEKRSKSASFSKNDLSLPKQLLARSACTHFIPYHQAFLKLDSFLFQRRKLQCLWPSIRLKYRQRLTSRISKDMWLPNGSTSGGWHACSPRPQLIHGNTQLPAPSWSMPFLHLPKISSIFWNYLRLASCSLRIPKLLLEDLTPYLLRKWTRLIASHL